MDGTCDTYGGEQKCMQGFVGNPEGKEPLGRPKRRGDNVIKIYLTETGWQGVNWIHLFRYKDQCRALDNAAINLRVPY